MWSAELDTYFCGLSVVDPHRRVVVQARSGYRYRESPFSLQCWGMNMQTTRNPQGSLGALSQENVPLGGGCSGRLCMLGLCSLGIYAGIE